MQQLFLSFHCGSFLQFFPINTSFSAKTDSLCSPSSLNLLVNSQLNFGNAMAKANSIHKLPDVTFPYSLHLFSRLNSVTSCSIDLTRGKYNESLSYLEIMEPGKSVSWSWLMIKTSLSLSFWKQKNSVLDFRMNDNDLVWLKDSPVIKIQKWRILANHHSHYWAISLNVSEIYDIIPEI